LYNVSSLKILWAQLIGIFIFKLYYDKKNSEDITNEDQSIILEQIMRTTTEQCTSHGKLSAFLTATILKISNLKKNNLFHGRGVRFGNNCNIWLCLGCECTFDLKDTIQCKYFTMVIYM